MSSATKNKLWVIGYESLGSIPANVFGRMIYDPELGIPIFDNRRFDPEDPEEAAEFLAAQKLILKSPRFKSERILVMPVSFFLARLEAKESANRRTTELAEENRLAAEQEAARLAAEAEKEKNPDLAHPDFTDVEELPPYEKWPLIDLKAEALRRGIDLAEGENAKKKAPWIALLEADDAADDAAAEQAEQTEEETTPEPED